MRIIAEFALRQPNVPIDYYTVFQSFIKTALSRSDKPYYEELYKTNKMKDFSFAAIFNKPIFQDDRILLDNLSVSFVVSSSDIELIIRFYNSFLSLKKEEFPLAFGNSMSLKTIRQVHLPVVMGNQAYIKFISPLLVRDHDAQTNRDYYLSYDDPSFFRVLVNSIKAQGIEILGKDITQGLMIVPVKPCRTVIKTFGNKLNGNLGIYKLTGSPFSINYLLNSGVGSRRSQGFGLFNLLQSKGGDQLE